MKGVAQLIKNKINEELSSHSINCAHGITKDNIQNHLVEPRIENYIGSINSGNIFEVWTVLEEHPREQIGYTIFIRKREEGEFGLGTHASNFMKI